MFKPMLAANADLSVLTFPCLASPKIDGIRALVKDGVVLSRSGRPIPNLYTQRLFAGLHGLDGELVVGPAHGPDVFRASSSGVMSAGGEPEVTFHVFDRWDSKSAYERRRDELLAAAREGVLPARAAVLEQVLLRSPAELATYEETCLAAGYEGVMLRRADAPYKFGRSTAREGFLLKVKRFLDAEAVIVGLEERRRNANAAVRNAVGGLERSTAREGLVPLDSLGAFMVRDVASGAEFSLGAGFTDSERALFWARGAAMLGQGLRYRYFPTGNKALPRFPVFAGLRDSADLGVGHA